MDESKNLQSAVSLEDNFKKTVAELLVLHLLSEQECYIGELANMIRTRSHGLLSIVFPYAAIYRLLEHGYIVEVKKRIAPDGRRRQYYKITDTGLVYLNTLKETYERMTHGVADVLKKMEDDQNG